MPLQYHTTCSKPGFHPASYLDPTEPGRLDRFWKTHGEVADEIQRTRNNPVVWGASESAPDRVFKTIDPSTREVIGTYQGMSETDVDFILYKANGAQEQWGEVTPEERAALLREIGAEVAKKRDRLAAIMMHESGKPIAQADADVKEALDAINYAAADIDTKVKEGVFDRYESRGVAGVIAPWNFPAAIPTIWVSNGLASGSAVVLKPSEFSPKIALEMAELFRGVLKRRGHNPDAVQLVLTKDPQVSKHFANNPQVATLGFTGSKKVGLEIVEQAGGRQVFAETGGTNPFVVGNDADLDRVCADIRYGAFGYSGQKCSHVQNVFIPRGKFDVYRERLKEMAESVVVGSAHEPQTLVGPLVLAKSRTDLDEILGSLPAEKIVVDGRTRDNGGNPQLVGPTIVTECDRLLTEEFFGPMINLVPYDTEEQVLEMIHRSPYGLTFAVETASPRVREFYLKRDLERGTGVMAGNLYSDQPPVGAEIGLNPFGAPGSNLSGTGSKTGGPESLMPFLKPKAGLDPSLRRQLERMPTGEEWGAVAKRFGKEFREGAPTELQYPGRTDLWEKTPMGQGLIVVDEQMDESCLERLVFGYLRGGNQVDFVYHQSCQSMILELRAKLLSCGLGGKIGAGKAFSLAPNRVTLGGLVSDPSRIRWVHLRQGYEPPEGFFSFFRSAEQSEQQRFITRINRGPAWIDDPHFTAQTQYHRVLSINTSHSGDVEKVVI